MLRTLTVSVMALAVLLLASCDEHKPKPPSYAELRRAMERPTPPSPSPGDRARRMLANTEVWESCWLGDRRLRVIQPAVLEQPASDDASKPYTALAGQVVVTISSGRAAPQSKCEVKYSIGRDHVTGFLPLSILAPDR